MKGRISWNFSFLPFMIFSVAFFGMPVIAAELSVVEQKHVTGGDRNLETHHSGASPMGAAWSGEMSAFIYHDYAPADRDDGMFMLLVDNRGEKAAGPIRLTTDYEYSHIVWNGTNFVAVVRGEEQIKLIAVTQAGERLHTKEISLPKNKSANLQADYNGEIYRIVAETEADLYTYFEINLDGVVQKEIKLPTVQGSLQSVEFHGPSLAVLSKPSFADGNLTFSILSADGAEIWSTLINNVTITPLPALEWNGDNFTVVCGKKNALEEVELTVYTFAANGGPVGEPRIAAVIPSKSYYYKINFTSHLIWTGEHYFFIWDQNELDSAMLENVYVRMLDRFGEPISAPLKINPETLDQTNHCVVSVGNSLRVFTIEQGSHNPSIVYTKVQADLNAPYVIPTHTPIPPTPTPTPTPTIPPNTQVMTFRGYIDGSDLLRIKDSTVQYKHLDRGLPGKLDGNNLPTYINGNEWFPTWSGSNEYDRNQVSNIYTSLAPSLPATDGYYYKILSENGRGGISIAQYPSSQNGYELLVLLDDVYHGAAAWYEFTLGWSTTPPDDYIILSNPPYIYSEIVISGRSADVVLSIQGDQIKTLTEEWNTVMVRRLIQTEPLPSKPLNLMIENISQSGTAVVLQQPRSQNNYTAQIGFNTDRSHRSDAEFVFVIRWQEVEPEPTFTPYPTFDPSQPTPTSVPEGTAPRVLWIVREEAISDNPYFNFHGFQQIFQTAGAQNENLIVGTKTIDAGLLQPYQAVIFGDTRKQPPISPEEQESLVRYVRNGGSIFVIGQQDSSAILEPPSIYATSITKPFGIEFSLLAMGGFRILSLHPLLSGVSDVMNLGSELIVTSPAIPLAGVKDQNTDKVKAILAIAEVGYGRVVAFGDEYLFTQVSENRGETSSRRFAQNVAAWLLHKEDVLIPPLPTATPTLMPAPSDIDAAALLQQVFEVNQSWLNPTFIQAEYSLLRKSNGSEENWGPYTVSEGGISAKRVGSTFVTSLHIAYLYPEKYPYQVRLAGRMEKQGVLCDVLDIDFTTHGREAIGFGGQDSTSFSHGDFRIHRSRIYINPQTKTPVLIESFGADYSEFNASKGLYTWTFLPDFLPLNGGLVPAEVEFHNSAFVRERQTFQIVEDVWIFKDGESWYGNDNSFGGTGLIQSIAMSNLTIKAVDKNEQPTSVAPWSRF